MHEVVIPTRYILTRDLEVGVWAGVAYMKDGKARSELLWGTNKFLGVEIHHAHQADYLYAVHHVFVERYIRECVKRPFCEVEIYKFSLERGDLPERPASLLGELVAHSKDPSGKDCWTSYQHISGPYLADVQYITSQFSASRLETISPTVTHNLIKDRADYLKNPQDLPQIGVIEGFGNTDEEGPPLKYYEDLLIRLRSEKPTRVN